jgi:hypothetical protein
MMPDNLVEELIADAIRQLHIIFLTTYLLIDKTAVIKG